MVEQHSAEGTATNPTSTLGNLMLSHANSTSPAEPNLASDVYSVIPVGVFRQLTEDHAEIMTGFLATSGAQGMERKQRHWNTLRAALLSHERAKSQEVYKALRDYPGVVTWTEELNHQACVIESIVRDLSALGFDTPQWRVEFERLRTSTFEHFEFEEDEVYSRAQDAMGADRAGLLELPYVAARRTHAQSFLNKFVAVSAQLR
jgi:hypothetical protein